MPAFTLSHADSIHAQSALAPCIGYLWSSGHTWHLRDGCPEVDRLARMDEDAARRWYGEWRIEIASLSQTDADTVRPLVNAALKAARTIAPREQFVGKHAPRFSVLETGTAGPNGVVGTIIVPTPAIIALAAVSSALEKRANGWDSGVTAYGSAGEDWLAERD